MLRGIANNTLLQMAMYQLVGQLVGAALTPYTTAVTNIVNQQTPLVPLSPAELAAAVQRGIMTLPEASHEARYSGLNESRFGVLAKLAGAAPAAQDLVVAYRREIIDRDDLDRGLSQGNLRPEWHRMVRELAIQLPSPELALNAYLEGQIGESRARDLFRLFGGDPDYFDLAYDTIGQAPSPLEAATMARRGIIPWEGRGAGKVSFEQAFLEGPWRNKWMDPIRQMSEYLPPPRTVTAMYREGSLSRSRAADLLRAQNLQEDLVQAYLTSATETKLEATKDLALSTIRALYADLIISRSDALDYIIGLGYEREDADYILQVEDLRLTQRYVNLAIGRVRTTYVGRKIDRATAISALSQLGVDNEQIGDLLGIWDLELELNTKNLTAAEIFSALELGIYTEADATRELVALGYTPRDAWIYLSVKSKRQLGSEPAAGELAGPEL